MEDMNSFIYCWVSKKQGDHIKVAVKKLKIPGILQGILEILGEVKSGGFLIAIVNE